MELYLIESYTTIPNSFSQIDESSVKTKNEPLVRYSDIISYNPDEYSFRLTDKAISAIANLKMSVSGIPFAVKADGELVYTGYFWPGYSSAMCSWPVIDPVMIKDNRIKVKIGYPGSFDEWNIPDRRNDERIIRIFKNDKKLK